MEPDHYLPDLTEYRSCFDSAARFDSFSGRFRELFYQHPHPEKSLSQFKRIVAHSLSKVILLRSLEENPGHFRLLSLLILKSDYFTDCLVRDPHLFSWLKDSGLLTGRFPAGKIEKDTTRAIESSDIRATRLSLLKQIHRRYLVTIGARDLLGLDSVGETTSLLTILADSVLTCIHQLLNREYFRETPVPAFTVLALGKYGGRELNYSSDIDLMAICDLDGELEWRGRTLLVSDVLVRWIQTFVDILSQPDADGFFYRVDFRLRPDGEFGPLVPTANGALDYYFSRGRTWERQMLLKIRPVLGDYDLANRFLTGIRSFIFNPLRQVMGIEHFHQSLEAVHENQGFNLRNIKTTPGGIRTVEFFCQTIQLEIGGQHPDLWNGNTLEVLEYLSNSGLIREEDAGILAENYQFYRRLEHHLQFFQNLQTHEIPKPGPDFQDFSARFSSDPAEALEEKITGSLKKVTETAGYYFPAPIRTEQESHPVLTLLNQWGELPKPVRELILEKNFTRVPSVVTSLDRIFKAFPSPASLLQLWISEPAFVKHILRVLDQAPVVTSRLISMPDIWEGLILNRHPDLYLEDDLHRFQVYSEIWGILGYLTGRLTLDQFLQLNSGMMKTVIRKRFSETPGIPSDLLLIALGKTATGESGPGSDADLVAFSDRQAPAESVQAFKLAASKLTEYTPYGIHFQVDFRLRPEGKNAPVLPELAASLSYYKNRADYWEFQTFTRASLISGSETLFSGFLNDLTAIFQDRKSQLKPRFTQLRQMRMNQHKSDPSALSLKKDAGGLLDIESLLQHLCLQAGFPFTALSGKPVSGLSALLQSRGSDDRLNRLTLLYREYRRFETEQKLSDQFRSGLFSPKTHWISTVIPDFATLKNFISESKQLTEELIRENT
ncbi:MAG: hypothetical protein L6Q77_06385 [Bacteroidetes bacterium]|nr:hypothetical protein [Bacteroidota bacterium]